MFDPQKLGGGNNETQQGSTTGPENPHMTAAQSICHRSCVSTIKKRHQPASAHGQSHPAPLSPPFSLHPPLTSSSGIQHPPPRERCLWPCESRLVAASTPGKTPLPTRLFVDAPADDRCSQTGFVGMQRGVDAARPPAWILNLSPVFPLRRNRHAGLRNFPPNKLIR